MLKDDIKKAKIDAMKAHEFISVLLALAIWGYYAVCPLPSRGPGCEQLCCVQGSLVSLARARASDSL